MQTKSFKLQVKADGLAEGQFEAYASVFGNVDSYGDVVVKGAFADSLTEWKDSGLPIPLLFGHRMDDPDFNLGTVEAVEDEHGLKVLATFDAEQLAIESSKTAQAYRLVKSGRVNQMSFAYDVLDGSQVEKDGQSYYELRKLRLHEVSTVQVGANQDTEILAVKQAAAAVRAGVKAGRVLAQKHIDSLRSAQEAIAAVITAAEAEDQGKAGGTTGDKSDVGDEGRKVKSPTAAEDRSSSPSVARLAAQAKIYALTGREES